MAERRGRFLEGLTPQVYRIGLVSFFMDVASEMLYPLIPVFLTAVLGAPIAVVGFIEGAAEATASLMQPVSGWLSDRVQRRRPFIFAGYSLSALAKPMMAFATGWPLVLAGRVSDRVGKGLRTGPRDALLARSVDPAYRGKAFGFHRAMDTMGAVVGPLLALVLVWLTGNDLRLILALSIIPGAISAGLVLLVREQPHTADNGMQAEPSTASREPLPASLRSYLFAWGTFAVANSSDVFLLLRARQLGYGTTLVVGLYVLYNLVYAAASPFLGGLSDRIGRARVMRGGLVVFALVYLGFALATDPWMLWPLFAIYGLYIASTEGVGKALAIDLAPAGIQARAVGSLGAVTGIATLIASSVAGVLWTQIGPGAAFLYGSIGAVIAALLFTMLPSLSRN